MKIKLFDNNNILNYRVLKWNSYRKSIEIKLRNESTTYCKNDSKLCINIYFCVYYEYSQ